MLSYNINGSVNIIFSYFYFILKLERQTLIMQICNRTAVDSSHSWTKSIIIIIIIIIIKILNQLIFIASYKQHTTTP